MVSCWFQVKHGGDDVGALVINYVRQGGYSEKSVYMMYLQLLPLGYLHIQDVLHDKAIADTVGRWMPWVVEENAALDGV